jgi:aminoglycoside 6'-N-acetyltransferase I
MVKIHKANIADVKAVTDILVKLYDSHDYDELFEENRHHLTNDTQIILLAYDGSTLIGAAHAAIRWEYVEGFDDSPVGYLEGIYTEPEYRYRGVARRLVAECEQWAFEHECSGFASDCELDNSDSLKFHISIGFRETSRNIHFIKELQ